jgi:hypothetical protein
MSSMKKLVFLVLVLGLFSASAWPIKIDGQSQDWANVRIFRRCPLRPLEKDRAGLDMKNIKLLLGKDYLYVYVDGRSVNGLKPDKGDGLKRTSIRVSFMSLQSPLNRVRIATDPDSPWQVTLSYPSITSEVFGSQQNKYWAFIRKNNKEAAFEMKIPVYHTKKGIQVGVPDGPLVRAFKSQHTQLTDVQINSVDMKTHRLVDTVEFPIHKGDL